MSFGLKVHFARIAMENDMGPLEAMQGLALLGVWLLVAWLFIRAVECITEAGKQ